LRDHHAVEKLLPHAGEFVGPQKVLAAEAGLQAQLNRRNEFVEGVDRFGPKLNRGRGFGANKESGGEDGGPLQTRKPGWVGRDAGQSPAAPVEKFDQRQQIGEFASAIFIIGNLRH
jgi:hypothetical protein